MSFLYRDKNSCLHIWRTITGSQKHGTQGKNCFLRFRVLLYAFKNLECTFFSGFCPKRLISNTNRFWMGCFPFLTVNFAFGHWSRILYFLSKRFHALIFTLLMSFHSNAAVFIWRISMHTELIAWNRMLCVFLKEM